MYENVDYFPFRFLDKINFFFSDFGVSWGLKVIYKSFHGIYKIFPDKRI